MASVSSLGAGSGLDLSGLLTNIMKAERQPKEALLTSRLASYNSKISGLGTLSSKLSSLQTAAQALKPSVLQTAAEKFMSYTGSLANSEIGKATVDTGALAGSYKLEVTSLATAQKTAITSKTGTVAPGTLTIQFGSAESTGFKADVGRPAETITISAGKDTLEDVANAINQKKIGISATVINGAGGEKQLTLTGQDGSNQAFSLDGLGFKYDPVAGAAAGDVRKIEDAADAQFTLDGIAVTSHSNKVTEALKGVTLDLVKTGATTLNITAEGESKLKSALEGFVKAYNDANSSMKTLGAYNPETKVAGALQGNSVLRDAQSKLSRLVFDTGLGDGLDKQTLSGIGVSVSKTGDGSLSIDADKLAAAIAKDPEAVANLAAAVGGAFDKELKGIVGAGGRIQASTDNLKTSVRDVEKRQEALELRMQQVEARYRAQFTALDTLVTKMNSLSNSLAGSLGSLMTSYNNK
jgi:flagellar hook-associated protein 2